VYGDLLQRRKLREGEISSATVQDQLQFAEGGVPVDRLEPVRVTVADEVVQSAMLARKFPGGIAR
jgi:hypothetical protein